MKKWQERTAGSRDADQGIGEASGRFVLTLQKSSKQRRDLRLGHPRFP